MIRGNSSSFSGRRYGGLLLSALVLIPAVLSVFGRVGWYEFLMYDDEPHLVDNPRLNPVTWSSVGLFWTEQSYWGLYIPLSYTFFAAEASIAGQPLNPAVFHLGNLVLHVACVLLVFVTLRRICRHDGAATAGALLFGLHPVQVESVAWISETRGLLCAMFSLLAVGLFDLWSAGTSACRRRLESPTGPAGNVSATGVASCNSSSWTSRRAMAHYALASAAFVLALLSKPAAVAVPLVAGVLAVGLRRRPLHRVLWALGPWLALAAGWVVLTKLQQPSGQMAFVAPVWTRPLIAGDALAFYLVKLAAPLQCGPDYGRTPQWVIEQWSFYLAWILPACLLAVLACLRDRRLWLTAAGVFIAWLLPVLGLLPFDFQRISTVADRYLYFSLLGPALALSWLLAHRFNRLTIAASAGVICVLAFLSFLHVAHWRDNNTLIEHGLRVNPRSVLAQQHRGALLSRQGSHEDAIKWYRRALGDHPRHEEAYISLAKSLLVLGRDEEAEATLREAARYVPRRPPVHRSLADLLVKRGKTLLEQGILVQGNADQAEKLFDEAQRHYRKAIELDPDWSVPYWSLAKLRFDRGATDEAIGLFRTAVDRQPDDAQARLELGRALEALGKLPEALNHYRVALRIRPDCPRANFNLANLLMSQGAVEAAVWHYRAELSFYPEYAQAHVNLGIALFEQLETLEAIRHYREALRIDPDLMEAHLNLGHALAAENRGQEAAAAYRAALKLVPPDSKQAEQIRQLLRPYENQ